MSSNSSIRDYEPGYVQLRRSGELKRRAEVLREYLKVCRLCPRDCDVDRTRDEKGECQAGSTLRIASHGPHHGEERPLSGRNGSGTIFFSHCSLLCVFCINYDISQLGRGNSSSVREMANMMLSLQRMGCHNINVVTPTHYSPYIVEALDIAAGRGLRIPLVYNTSGWEKMEILQLLDGVVDIYLADFKYFDADMANRYSPGARSYPEITKAAIKEMHRQVGVAKPDERDGLMRRGLMIRHLVMPNNVGGSADIMRWIAENVSRDTYINIMSQYMPAYRAGEFREINRGITAREQREVIEAAVAAGLTNLDIQGG